MTNTPVTLEVLAVRLDFIQEDLKIANEEIKAANRITAKIQEQISASFVSKKEFEDYQKLIDERIKPLVRLVYGLVGLILIAVASAGIAIIMKGGI